jgi:hypothetical protein
LNFGTLAGLGSRPQAQMTMSLKLKMILLLRPFKRAIICPILIVGTRVMLVKVYFFGKGPGQGQIPGHLSAF